MIRIKKIAIFLIGGILFLGILNFGLNVWIEFKLPQLLADKNNSDYNIAYKDIDISLWNTSLKVVDVSIAPKTEIENTNKKIGIYAKVPQIKVAHFSILSILFGDKIKADQLVIVAPEITLHKNNDEVLSHSKSIQSKIIEPFEKIIVVNAIYLSEGKVQIVKAENDKLLASLKQLNLKIEGLVLNEKTLQKEIPFTYENYSINCTQLLYQINEFYTLKVSKFNTTNTSLQIEGLQLKPTCSRKVFVQKIPKERDLYTVSAKQISLKELHWGFQEDVFFCKVPELVLNQLDATIYRGKMPEDDLSKKKLYNNLLRNLPFDLQVDTLKMVQSKIVYEEEKTFEEGPGKLIFDAFNLKATSIQSGFDKKKVPDTEISIQTQFMEESMLDVDWSFNVLDSTDGFKIKGKLNHFNAEKLVYFTKPYLNVVVKGDLEKVYFNFKGNDVMNEGDFALKYDDLKVEIYQNNKRYKKNGLLTAIGNLFVKDDSGEELKAVSVKVERVPEKSFYNLLWISVADGLKKVLL